jgi:putative nucleotidyltransferase with HDIG domain
MAPVSPEKWRPDQVPPFPAVALKALNLIAGRDTSLLELCNLIRPDPAFSSEVLRIANSPLVAFSREITNVLQASMLLGFRRMRSVVVTVGLRAYMADGFTPLLRSCWRHSVACGIIAERAAKACALDKELAYTGGVLHDLGRIVLAVSMSEEYQRLVEQGADDAQDFLRAERARLGIDHCQVGGILVTEWSLPPAFLTIATCHHDEKAEVATADSIVALSCLMADALGFGPVQYRKPLSYSDIVENFPKPAHWLFPPERDLFAEEMSAEIALIESA